MNSPRLLHDIKAQPESFAKVLERQRGEGREALLRAAALMTPGKRVVITGMGASMYACSPLEYFLGEHGIQATLIESAELLYYRQELCRNAVVLMVSRSGESVEVVKLLAALKGSAKVIGVSNVPGSVLDREADCSLQVGSLADEMVALQSYTGTLLTLHLLGAAVVNRFAEGCAEAEGVQRLLPGVIESNIGSLLEWDEFLDAATPVYLLARGPSCGSMNEGALLFNETAKAPSVAMEAASFRHGPVELVEEGFRGMVFAPQGRTRALDLALARDLVRFGGQVRVIGPAGDHTEGLTLCEVPETAEGLAPMLEIIPVQCAALRLAQLKGLRVGSFRYTPQVTRDEATFAC
jgi:glucosamine--fructose-6-phosphate aminotransferase (isomerizing)